MHCPYCGHNDSHVIDSREAGEGIRRRRECLQCSLRFTTYERVQTASLFVVKRDGRREEFNRDKLTESIRLACVKRPLPTGAIDRVVNEIETQFQNLGRAEIPSKNVGEMVMSRLKDLDRVAYIRFASVYRDFADLETFREEVDAMLVAREAEAKQVPNNQGVLIPPDDAPPIPGPRRRGRPRKQDINTQPRL